MPNRTHDHCLPSSYEHRQSPLTSQPQHQPHGPACLIILPLWLEMGDLCVCLVRLVCVCLVCVCLVCVCLVCVLSVCALCVCVCVCVCLVCVLSVCVCVCLVCVYTYH